MFMLATLGTLFYQQDANHMFEIVTYPAEFLQKLVHSKLKTFAFSFHVKMKIIVLSYPF